MNDDIAAMQHLGKLRYSKNLMCDMGIYNAMEINSKTLILLMRNGIFDLETLTLLSKEELTTIDGFTQHDLSGIERALLNRDKKLRSP